MGGKTAQKQELAQFQINAEAAAAAAGSIGRVHEQAGAAGLHKGG
jgi:hypothetical protein